MISKKFFVILSCLTLLLVNSCDSWMNSDDFFANVEEQVKVANAVEINVFTRYANTKMGSTTPAGKSVQKVEVPFTVSCTTTDDYGFYRWAAFSTSDFNTTSQHSNLIYEDDESYEQWKSKELTDKDILIKNPKDISTEVTILTKRNDIFLIPVVARRPVVATSLPANGATGVAKNIAIRLVFSKPMDVDTLIDPETKCLSENISISISDGDFDDLKLIDITEKFVDVSLGESKKTLTIRLGSDDKMDPNKPITITVSPEVKDIFGYQMGSAGTISFTTGTKEDNLAPYLETVTAGYKNPDEWGYNQDTFAGLTDYFKPVKNNESSSYVSKLAYLDSSNTHTSTILDHRTDGKVRFYVYAQDTVNGSSQFVEADVYQLYVRATHLCSPDGSETGSKIERKNYSYNIGGKDSETPKRYFNNGSGFEFTYDISSLPDGVVRIDVGAVDTIGNDSFTSGCVSGEQNNYYKSVYVILDRKAPVQSTEALKVYTKEVETAPYHWYNSNSIAELKLVQRSFETNPICDFGDLNLGCKPENMLWSFSLDGGKNWTDWAFAKNVYSITNASKIAKDGELPIYVRFSDDLNNVSESALLESITYDNTIPVVGELSWVNVNDSPVINSWSSTTLGKDRILKVPYTEELSGVKEIQVSVNKTEDSGALGTSIPQSTLVFSSDSQVTKVISNKGKVLDSAITSDTVPQVYISGIQIGEVQGHYTVSVNFWDSALNKAVEKRYAVVNDSTKPVINTVKIEGLIERTVYGSTEKAYYLPKSAFETRDSKAINNSIVINTVEESSGVTLIKISGNAKISEATKVETDVSGAYKLVPETEYVIDTENNQIQFSNYINPVLKKSSGSFNIRLSSIAFDEYNSEKSNKINVTLKDFVDLSSDTKSKVTYSTADDVSEIYADSLLPEILSVVLKDNTKNTANNPQGNGYNDGFTDSSNINVHVIPKAEGSFGSGIKKIISESDVKFVPGTTKVFVGETEITADCSISANSIIFNKYVFNTAQEITIRNVNCSEKFVEGIQSVELKVSDLVGWEAENASSGFIVYDITAPVIGQLAWNATVSGEAVGIATGKVLDRQILNVPFTEEVAGVKNIVVSVVQPDNTKFENTVNTSVKLTVAGNLLENDTDYTISRYSTKDAVGNNLISLKNPVKNGLITLNGLVITEKDQVTEGSYKVNVRLLDAAENLAAVKTISIVNDSTKPVINSIKVENLIQRTAYGITGNEYYLPKAAFAEQAVSADKTVLVINATEKSAGIAKIALGGTVFVTANTKLYTNASGTMTLVPETEYTVNTETNTITLWNFENPVLCKNSAFDIKLTDVKFSKANTTEPNTINAVLTDFVRLDSNPKTKFTYSTTDDVSEIYGDSLEPSIETVIIKDNSANGLEKIDPTFATNANSVDVIVKLSADETDTRKGSGVKSLSIVSGASFNTSQTKVILGGTDITGKCTIQASSITFKNYVFTTDQTLELKNVQLSAQADGETSVSLKVTDLTGWTQTVSTTDSIILDKTVPELTSLSWTTAEGVPGYVSEKVLPQLLNINFKEDVTGVKKIVVGVKNPSNVAYGTPLASAVVSYAGTVLTEGTDYSVNTAKTEISFDSNIYKTGLITIKNIQIADTNVEGTYKVSAKIYDSAENTASVSEKTINVIYDATKPVINKVEIPGLYFAEELQVSSTQFYGPADSYWLSSEFTGGTGNSSYDPSNITAYITLTETHSGISKIKFGGTFNVTENTKIYLVSGESQDEIDSSKYTLSTSNKTISVNKTEDAFKGDNFVLCVTKLKSVRSSYKHNLSLSVQDVALNNSIACDKINLKGKETQIDEFYSDSEIPQLNDSSSPMVLADRSGTGSTDIEFCTESTVQVAAAEGYTNERNINVKYNVNAEGSNSSGFNRFKLEGAVFSDNTVISLSGNKNISLDNTKFVLSTDKREVTLKDPASDKYYVIRSACTLTITNVILDATTDGSTSVKLTGYDLSGWQTKAMSSSNSYLAANIVLDMTPPDSFGGTGPFVYNPVSNANDSSYYANCVYPHPKKDTSVSGLTSDVFDGGVIIKNKDEKAVRYFYKNKNYKSRTSSVSECISIGFPLSDNIALGDTYYLTNTLESLIDSSKVIANGIKNPSKYEITSLSNTATRTNYYYYLTASDKPYSYVAVDKAGNCSKAYTFYISEDGSKPSNNYDGSLCKDEKLKSLSNLMTVITPENTNVFRNTKITENISRNKDNFDFYDNDNHDAGVSCYDFVVKKESGYKVVVKVATGTKSGDLLVDGKPVTAGLKYKDLKPSASESGIEYYSVTHWYGNWYINSSSSSFEPAFPEGTTYANGVTPGTNFVTYYNDGYVGSGFNWQENENSEWIKEGLSWHKYSEKNVQHSNIDVYSKVNSDGDIEISIPDNKDTPPLTLLFKDGCGNLGYALITSPALESNNQNKRSLFGIRWVVDDHIAEGLDTGRNIVITPLKREESSGPVYLNGNYYDWYYRTSSYQQSKKSGSVPLNNFKQQLKNYVFDTKNYINYYNQYAAIALTIDNDVQESCLYDEQKDVDYHSDYTARARIMAWPKDSSAPTYDDFVKNDERYINDYSNWHAVQNEHGANINFVLKVPNPTFGADSRLTKNVPYKIYYFVEDAVGNYEINTVVTDHNDQMNLWYYDNDGPNITVNGTNKKPHEITASDIKKLVPNNNGYKAYVNNSTKVISVKWDRSKRDTENQVSKNDLGNGVTVGYVSTPGYRNGLYFNLNVDEASGIRAYKFSTSITPPSFSDGTDDESSSSTTDQSTACQEDNSEWYAGSYTRKSIVYITVPFAIYKFIGSEINYPYKSSGSSTPILSNKGEVFYDKYDDNSSEYYYTGVKLCETIPVELIGSDNNTTPKEIYLHVMDWVGNVSTVRFGPAGYKWVFDTDAPEEKTLSQDIVEADYFINKDNLNFNFAGKKDVFNSDYKLYYPDILNDTASGMYGWSFTNNDVGTVLIESSGSNSGKSFIVLEEAIRNAIKAGQTTTVTLYAYDNVGNLKELSLDFTGDIAAPDFVPYIKAYNDAGNTALTSFIKESYSSKADNNIFAEDAEKRGFYDDEESIVQNSYHAIVSEGKVRFFYEGDTSDIFNLFIYKWDNSASKWTFVQEKTSSWSTETSPAGFSTPVIAFDSGAYYMLQVRDKVGNLNSAYVQISKDATAPVITVTENSFEKVNKVGTNNYFGKDSTVKLAYKDEESGLKSYKKNGSLITPASYTDSVEEFTEKLSSLYDSSSNKLIVSATNNVNLTNSYNLTLNSIETFVKDEISPATPTASSEGDENTFSAKRKWNGYDYGVSCYDYSDTDGYLYITEASEDIMTLTFTPTATDVSGILGFIECTEERPESLKTFYSASDSSVKKDFTYTCNSGSSGTVDFKLSRNDSDKLVRWYYSVDYAGNVSENPLKITYKYSSTSVPQVSKVTFTPDTDTAIYQKDGKNYILSGSVKFDFGIKDRSDRYYATKIYLYQGASNEYVLSRTVSDLKTRNDYSSAKNADGFYEYIGSNNKFDLKSSVLNSGKSLDGTDELRFYLVNSKGNSEPKVLSYNEVNKWVIDSSAPDVSGITISSDTEGVYWDAENKKLYYKDGVSQAVLTVTGVTDEGSGFKGFGTKFDSVQSGETYTISLSGSSTSFNAFDNVGNKSTAITVTLAKDSTKPDAPSAKTFVDSTGADLDEKYYSGNYVNANKAVDIKVSTSVDTGSGIKGYFYATEAQTSPAASLTNEVVIPVPETETTFYVYAVDKVGNLSAPYSFTVIPDKTAPAGTASVSAVTDAGDGFYYNAENGNLYFSGSKSSSDVTFDGITDEGSGLAGYSFDAGTKPTSTAVTISSFTDNAELSVYAWDNVGNTAKVMTIKLVKDAVSPAPAAQNIWSENNRLKSNLTVTKTYDNDSGDTDYITNVYESGSSLILDVVEGGSGLASYGFVTSDNTVSTPSEPASYTEITTELSGNTLTVPFITVSEYHKIVWLWLKDNAGNKKYVNIASSTSQYENWWLAYEQIDNVKANYASQKVTVFNIPVGSSVKAVKVYGEGIGISHNWGQSDATEEILKSGSSKGKPENTSVYLYGAAKFEATSYSTAYETGEKAGVIVTFSKPYVVSAGKIEITLNSAEANVTEVQVVDIKGNVSTVTSENFAALESRSIASKAASLVSGFVSTVKQSGFATRTRVVSTAVGNDVPVVSSAAGKTAAVSSKTVPATESVSNSTVSEMKPASNRKDLSAKRKELERWSASLEKEVPVTVAKTVKAEAKPAVDTVSEERKAPEHFVETAEAVTNIKSKSSGMLAVLVILMSLATISLGAVFVMKTRKK